VFRSNWNHQGFGAIAETAKRHGGHVVQITTSLIEHASSHVPMSPPKVLAAIDDGEQG